MQLHHVQAGGGRRPPNLLGIVRSKYADTFYTVAGGIENPAAGWRINAARTIGEHDSYVARSDLGGERSVLGACHAAELNLCEHCRSS